MHCSAYEYGSSCCSVFASRFVDRRKVIANNIEVLQSYTFARSNTWCMKCCNPYLRSVPLSLPECLNCWVGVYTCYANRKMQRAYMQGNHDIQYDIFASELQINAIFPHEEFFTFEILNIAILVHQTTYLPHLLWYYCVPCSPFPRSQSPNWCNLPLR